MTLINFFLSFSVEDLIQDHALPLAVMYFNLFLSGIVAQSIFVCVCATLTFSRSKGNYFILCLLFCVWASSSVVCVHFRQCSEEPGVPCPSLEMFILITCLRCCPVFPLCKCFFLFVMNDSWDACCLVWGRGFENNLDISEDEWTHLVLWLFEFTRFQSVIFFQ